MKVLVLRILGRLFPVLSLSALAAAEPGQYRHPEKVAEVLSGKRDIANVAWWGFDKEDATDHLRQALASGAKTVIVPNMGSDWVVGPIRLPCDNQEIIFERGVVVSAKRDGAFYRGTEQLIALYNRKNVVLRGYGATLKMWKEDYLSDPYQSGEHRHALGVHLSENVRILGLTVENSGGDGIYVRSCRNIHVKDIVSDGNRRQGISVTGVRDLLIEDTIVRNTAGTSPESGIDLEPNHPRNGLVNVVIRNTTAENNAGRGFIVSLGKLNSESEPVSIRFENCTARNNLEGISVMRLRDNGVQGLVEFIGTVSEGNRLSELAVRDKSSKAGLIRFVDCTFRSKKSSAAPMYWGLEVHYEPKDNRTDTWGGLEFEDCIAETHGKTPLAQIGREVLQRGGVCNVKGTVTLRSSNPGEVLSKELADMLFQAGLKVSTVKVDPVENGTEP